LNRHSRTQVNPAPPQTGWLVAPPAGNLSRQLC
jgi:hypothetical protein